MIKDKKILINPISGSIFAILLIANGLLTGFEIIGPIPFVITDADTPVSNTATVSPNAAVTDSISSNNGVTDAGSLGRNLTTVSCCDH